MRLCIVSETWSPEINGVAHTLNRICRELQRLGVTMDVIRPKPKAPGSAAYATQELQVNHLALPGYRD
ncbi:MAG: glycosyltransferase family 1 protein, partial [Pseudomonadota bacterium]|nr:glycosyltransferase family 1 protein [Pseudomonadota bacterium]